MKNLIEYECRVQKLGYEVFERKFIGRQKLIRPVKGKQPPGYREKLLAGLSPNVFEALVNIKETEKDAVRFTNEYGLLIPGLEGRDALLLEDEFFYEARLLRTAAQLASSKNWSELESFAGKFRVWTKEGLRDYEQDGGDREVALESERATGLQITLHFERQPACPAPRFSLRANSLAMFAWLQFFMSITEMRELRICEPCGKFFGFDPTNKQRRSRTYCSDRCRVAAHRNRQKEQQSRSRSAPKAQI